MAAGMKLLSVTNVGGFRSAENRSRQSIYIDYFHQIIQLQQDVAAAIP